MLAPPAHCAFREAEYPCFDGRRHCLLHDLKDGSLALDCIRKLEHRPREFLKDREAVRRRWILDDTDRRNDRCDTHYAFLRASPLSSHAAQHSGEPCAVDPQTAR